MGSLACYNREENRLRRKGSALEIELNWWAPIVLREGRRRERFIYTPTDDAIELPNTPGIYIFARQHGDKVNPLYIGRASNLRQRIEQQFCFVPLMKGIQDVSKGGRVLLLGELAPRRGLRAEKALQVVEEALIAHALTDGKELLNKQGTRTPVHTVWNYGNRQSRQIAPLKMTPRRS